MKKLLTIFRYPVTFLFLLGIGLPALNQWTGIWHFERRDENRRFQDSVRFDISLLDPFPASCEAYLNDNFSFRTPLLDVYHTLSFRYFRISPHPEKTIIGQDDWYFMAGKEKRILEGTLKFSPEQLRKFETEWRSRKQYLDSMGIPFLWLIAPMKHQVYPEYLPFNVRPVQEDRMTQLDHHFKKHLPGVLVNLRPLLIAAKKEHKLFYQLDNHWNFHAGEVVSRYITDQLRKKIPGRPVPEIGTVHWHDTLLRTGIHQNVLGLATLQEVDQVPVLDSIRSVPVVKHDFPPVPYFAYPGDYEMRFMNLTDSGGLRLLVIRDSFGEKLLPFLKESFQETVFIFDAWQYGLNREIIEHLRPDAVVYLGSEVHVEHIIGLD